MTFRFAKNLYSKVALLKAAYSFTDKYYLHLDEDGEEYMVEIIPKKKGDDISAGEFENEMLAQAVRYEVYTQTKDIRKLLVARAMASTVVGDEEIEENNEDAGDIGAILKDWFENDKV